MSDITELGIVFKGEPDAIQMDMYGLGAWSYSKVKVLSKCPFHFYLQYILKAKLTTPAPVSVITETGKASHRILELAVNGKSVGDAFKIVKKEFELALPGVLWDDGEDPEVGGVGRVEYSVSNFMNRLSDFERRYPVKRYITELKIGITKNWEPTGFFTSDYDHPENDVWLRGVIDLVIQLQNGDVLFIDHKHGPDAKFGVKNFQAQLDWYKVMFSKGVETYNNAQSGVNFVRAGEIVMGTMTSKEDVENNLARRIEFEIQGAIEKVKEFGFFKHIAGSPCTYCDYKIPCKAGLLKPMELGTKRFFNIKAV